MGKETKTDWCWCYENPNAAAELIDQLDADLAAKDARIAELEEAILNRPVVNIEFCQFQGSNSDGSPVLEYEAVQDSPIPIVRIKSVTMKGWMCIGPRNDAAPSEDGREVAEAVAWLNEEWGSVTASSAVVMDWDDSEDRVSSLMTVAQHERIVAAKDAELRELRDSMTFRTSLVGRLEAELEQLRAQPARQVGGDEREKFEAWVRREWPAAPLGYVRDALPKNDPRYGEYCDDYLQRAWVGWQARAALAPAAVVMPERANVLYGTSEDMRDAEIYNDALDEVARLNRNAIPVGLLERVCADRSLTPGHNAAINAIDELRALLGKEGE